MSSNTQSPSRRINSADQTETDRFNFIAQSPSFRPQSPPQPPQPRCPLTRAPSSSHPRPRRSAERGERRLGLVALPAASHSLSPPSLELSGHGPRSPSQALPTSCSRALCARFGSVVDCSSETEKQPHCLTFHFRFAIDVLSLRGCTSAAVSVAVSTAVAARQPAELTTAHAALAERAEANCVGLQPQSISQL